MEERVLGKSGLSITPIGLGLAALGRPGYINLGHSQDLAGKYGVRAMEKRAHIMLDTAWANGIRYFDAARSYGQAEAFLSSWLAAREIRLSNVTIGSKWGYTYTAGWEIEAEQHEIKEHSLEVLLRQFRESQDLLAPYLSLYQIHSATLESGVLTNKDVISELARLKTGGMQIGLSLSGPEQAAALRQALTINVDGRPLFSTVQATWNILAQEAGDALNEASAAGMGVIIKEALANGRLTARNKESSFARKRSLLEEAAAHCGTTIDAVAIAVVLSQPWVDMVLSGATTEAQLLSNCQALIVANSSMTEELLRSMPENPSFYWKTRSQLAWN